MAIFFVCVSLAVTLLYTGPVAASFRTSSQDNIAIYWGQDSRNDGSQQGLAHYCANTEIDIIPLAFLYQFYGTGNQPVLNFANSENGCSTFDGTALIDCPEIGADIATCQQTYGKTILLSIGGATYTEGGYSSSDEAIVQADKIWAMFGPQQSGSSALRPFGSASIDGFDFDYEATVQNVVPFANRLRSLMDADTSKQHYLTAAPQCPYPDAADNDMLNGAVFFNAIFIQFYNNYCGVDKYDTTTPPGQFNLNTWDNWAKTVSLNPNVRLLVGVPGSATAAGSGYIDSSKLAQIINYSKQFSNFGGVMMWDASQEEANTGYLDAVYTTLHSSSYTSRIVKRWVSYWG